MKKILKWGFIGISVLVLIIAALLLAPFFMDVQQYKPQIESRVSEITGRPFTLGGDIRLTLFPWAGLSLSDIHLGNPPGFETTDFLFVKSFEVRVELLPLLSKDIQIKRVSMKSPIITLIRNPKGMENWEGLAHPEKEDRTPVQNQQAPPDEMPGEEFSIDSLAINQFTLSDGILLWVDQLKEERREIRNLTMELKDLSLVQPVQIECSAKVDQHPVSIHGTVGPVGKNPGKGTVPVDISVGFLNEKEMKIKGKLIDPEGLKDFDVQLQIQPFSPRKVFGSMGKAFPIKTTDAKAFNTVALDCRIRKTSSSLSLTHGSLNLDKTTLNFSADLKNMPQPEIAFDLNLDRLDMDRYLPPKEESQQEQEQGTVKNENKNSTVSGGKPNYKVFRTLTLRGGIFIKELQIKGAKIQDFHLKLMGEKGLFWIQPIGMKLYEGKISGAGSLNLAQDVLRTQIQLKASGIRAGPMIRDILKKDIMEGDLAMDLKLNAAGNKNNTIKKSLHGKGTIQFTDGAINGIDLSGMLQNSRAALERSKGSDGIPHTRYNEFTIPFTILDGVVKTTETTLTSPLLKVQAKGQADIVAGTLDFRIEPLFMAPLKGREKDKNKKGLTIPVLVGGTFSSPMFIPDLDFILKQNFGKEVKGLSELQKALLENREDDKRSRGAKIIDFLKKLR